MKLFPTFDMSTLTIILTQYDPQNLIFFDPITDKNYDYPFVFKNESDLQQNLPQLIHNLIHHTQNKINKLTQSKYNLATFIHEYTHIDTNVYYYLDFTTLSVKSLTIKNNNYIDIITNNIIPKQTIYTTFNKAYTSLYPFLIKYSQSTPLLIPQYNWIPIP